MNAPSKVFPALRARMGDRWYYISTLTFSEVAKWIRPVDEIHERAEFKTWLQRKVKFERKAEIADYLKSKPQRFFNAVVAGIYGGEPEWIPVTVDAPDKLKDVVMGERQTTSHGLYIDLRQGGYFRHRRTAPCRGHPNRAGDRRITPRRRADGHLCGA
jgi:hypothetical protein